MLINPISSRIARPVPLTKLERIRPILEKLRAHCGLKISYPQCGGYEVAIDPAGRQLNIVNHINGKNETLIFILDTARIAVEETSGKLTTITLELSYKESFRQTFLGYQNVGVIDFADDKKQYLIKLNRMLCLLGEEVEGIRCREISMLWPMISKPDQDKLQEIRGLLQPLRDIVEE